MPIAWHVSTPIWKSTREGLSHFSYTSVLPFLFSWSFSMLPVFTLILACYLLLLSRRRKPSRSSLPTALFCSHESPSPLKRAVLWKLRISSGSIWMTKRWNLEMRKCGFCLSGLTWKFKKYFKFRLISYLMLTCLAITHSQTCELD